MREMAMEHHRVIIDEIGLSLDWNDGDEIIEASLDGHVFDHMLIREHPHAQAVEYAAAYVMSIFNRTVQ
jgi:hypothetical protein